MVESRGEQTYARTRDPANLVPGATATTTYGVRWRTDRVDLTAAPAVAGKESVLSPLKTRQPCNHPRTRVMRFGSKLPKDTRPFLREMCQLGGAFALRTPQNDSRGRARIALQRRHPVLHSSGRGLTEPRPFPLPRTLVIVKDVPLGRCAVPDQPRKVSPKVGKGPPLRALPASSLRPGPASLPHTYTRARLFALPRSCRSGLVWPDEECPLLDLRQDGTGRSPRVSITWSA